MNTALATTNNSSSLAQFGEMSVQTIVDRKRKMAEVMEAVMQDGVHYGKIPGCGDKPSLFKAGAEVCATVFGLAPKFKITRNDLPGGHREYEIICTLEHIATGAIIGEGVGCCSTMESKYRWRKGERKCPNCSQPTVRKGKNQGDGWYCWAKIGGCGAKWNDGAKEIEGQEVGRVENPDIADSYNTVLKIAKKRAQVDATLTATGASDILTQDLEDLPMGSAGFVNPADQDIAPPPRQQSQQSAPQRSNGNGHSNGSSRNSNAQQPAEDPIVEEAAMELIAALDDARTPDQVTALAPRFNSLPKGTRARASAYDAYKKRLKDVTPPAVS